MGEREGKLDPSLPPNYVSLAQLQERWFRKQQEMKLKGEKEEEQKEKDARTQNRDDGNQNQRELENDLPEKMAGLSLRDELRRKGGKDGRKMGVIEDKGKGKEKLIGGFQDGVEKKRNKKKRMFRKKKSMADGEKEKLRSEIKDFDGGDESGVEVVPGNEVKVGIKGLLSGESSGRDVELKGTEEIGAVNVEVQDVKRVDYGGGFRRNGYNWGSGYKSKKEYGKKMEDEKGYGKSRRERRRNGKYREHHRLKENRVDVLKGNAAEPKAEDEVLEACNEIGGVNGKNKNDDGAELENKVDDEVLVMESAKSGETGQYGNGYELENKVDDEVLVMESAKSAEKGQYGNGYELENKVDDEVLVVESANGGEKGQYGDGYRRYGNGNWRENVGRRGGGFTYNDRRYVRSRMEVNDGFGRRFTRFGRFGDRRRTKPRESGMVWVKKEEKKGADAAEVGSSGITVDQA